MPRVKTSRNVAPPGFEAIEDRLNSFERRLREAEAESHEGRRKNEAVWPVFRITHQRSRFIYDMYYVRKEVCRENFFFQFVHVLFSSIFSKKKICVIMRARNQFYIQHTHTQAYTLT